MNTKSSMTKQRVTLASVLSVPATASMFRAAVTDRLRPLPFILRAMNASSDGGLSPRQCSTATWRQWVVLASAALLTVTPAHAQTGPGCFANVCLPNEFEVGVGVLDDRILRGSPAVFLLGLSFISSEWPLDFVFEGDFGATMKDAPECRLDQETPNCFDASLLVGPRFRLVRGDPQRRVLPFVNTLMGSYWKGSGLRDDSSASAHFALQFGSKVDVHRPESIQGLRLAVDYRRVLAYGQIAPGLNQVRFSAAYVLNERAVSP